MKPIDRLQAKIDRALNELLDGKSKKTTEEKDDLRKDVLLAIKWQAVKLKIQDDAWGSGFNKNGKGENDDAGLDDE